ncbi:phosphotransferase family protein [Sphingomonas bacterium]|uniref:phosphotransferase family protein n=1 Tax=Sphingomonas bacterium TaxID=1895847 RepID=UPI0020C60FA1|nr:phosphotransferase family protein [Sphingomonas bacterium]
MSEAAILDRTGALRDWFDTHLPTTTAPLRLDKFPGGQSNPTYRVSTGETTYVLRRKPSGTVLPSAHAVEREFRLLSALHPVGFPVPEPLALCEDPSVIGAPFYVMTLVEGTIHWNGALPDRPAEERRCIYEGLIDTLARLHTLEPAAVDLEDFGRPGDFFARQLDRWTRQHHASRMKPVPELDKLVDWLPRHRPPQRRSTIVHGDYRIDNAVFAGPGPRVAALLDWELATIGDPLADIAYLALGWILPAEGRSGLAGLDPLPAGIPTLDDVIARYCAATGRDGIPELPWLLAFSLFRLAVILQGVGKRAAQGNASGGSAAQEAARVGSLARAAWEHARAAGAS